MTAANIPYTIDDISPFTGEFLQKSVEEQFRREHVIETISQAKSMFVVVAIAAAVILAVSLLASTEPRPWLTTSRIGVIGLSLAGYILVTRIKPRMVEPLIICWQVAVTLTAAVFATTHSNAALVAVFLLPALFYLAVPVGFRTAVAMGLFSSVLLLVAYNSGGSQGHDLGIAVALLVMNSAFWLVNVRTGRWRRLEWSALQAHRSALSDLAESQSVLERTFAAVPVPLIVTSAESGTIIRANEAAEQFLKLGPGELIGRVATSFYADPSDRPALVDSVRDSGLLRDVPFAVRTSSGESRSVLLSSSIVADHDGAGTRLVTSVVDMTEQKRREERLRVAEAEYRKLFENAVVGIYRSTPDGRMLRANPALVQLNGYDSEAELIDAVQDIAREWYVHPQRRDEWLRLMRENGRVMDFVSEVYRHKTRERIWISENGWTIYGVDGELLFEGTLIEATERKRAEAKTEYLARYDPLTDLANRTLLNERLEEASSRVDRHGGHFAVFCIDLDRFKAVNDAFGHAAGDLLLKEAGRRLASACRSEDTVARLGGDEFAIIQVGFEDPASAACDLATTILDAFKDPFVLEGHRVLVGASIGIALAPIDGSDPQELLKKADLALYRAKADGKSTFRFFNLEAQMQARPSRAKHLLEARRRKPN